MNVEKNCISKDKGIAQDLFRSLVEETVDSMDLETIEANYRSMLFDKVILLPYDKAKEYLEDL